MRKKIYSSMCILSASVLILSMLLILSACYTSFNSSFKDEIKKETQILANMLNSSDNAAEKLADVPGGRNMRITLISPNGDVTYDSASVSSDSESHLNRPEIQQAIKNGFGESQRFSDSLLKIRYYCAVRLDNGSILRVCVPSRTVPAMLPAALFSLIIVAALIYLISSMAANKLTESILEPIEKLDSYDTDSFDGMYDEIQPFLRRISRQNDEIKRQMAKVMSQKVRLQAIMDNINEGLLIVDKSSEILSVNKCALDIFGSNEETVKHKNFETLTDRDEIHSAVQGALRGKKGNLMLDFGGKMYQIFCSPLYEKSEISGAVLLLFDMREKSESEKIRREFTANVSHELKTPLTTIHGYAQIISGGIAKPQDVAGFVEKIEKESARLIALVDDIINLSRLDEGTGEAQHCAVSLMTAVCEVAEQLAGRAAERGIQIDILGGDSDVYASPSQVAEMIYNLTDNAIKYNRPGGSVKITVSDKTVSVSDTGIGIPEKYYDRIFERFFRVDKSHSKKVNGTGLGLSIVKHLAISNGANITVQSEVGKGSTFTVEFAA